MSCRAKLFHVMLEVRAFADFVSSEIKSFRALLSNGNFTSS